MSRVVRLGHIKLSDSIFSNQLVIAILLLPFLKTSGFDFIPGLSEICNVMLVLECILLLGINILENRMSPFYKIIIVLEIWTFFIAPLISKCESPSFFYLAGTLGIISFFELGFSVSPKRMLAATSKMFTMMILLNAVMLLMIPGGISGEGGVNYYLFGLRTGFSLFVIPGMMFNHIYDKMKGRLSLRTVVAVIASIFSLLNQWVATGIVQLAIAFILLFSFNNRNMVKKINVVWIAIVLFVLNFFVTAFGSQNKIMLLVTSIMNKDITISGRTQIWSYVIEKIKTSPIAGLGNDSTVTVGIVEKSAHNHWLHVAMEGGCVAVVLLIIAILVSCIYLYKNCNSEQYNICMAFMVATLVGCITEIQTYVPFFYLIFEMPFLLWKTENIQKVQKRLVKGLNGNKI